MRDDEVVKSQTQRICHFDRREKSYDISILHLIDFSFHSKWQVKKTFYEYVKVEEIEEIKEKIIEEFEVTPEEAEKDLLEHIEQLKGIKAVIEG